MELLFNERKGKRLSAKKQFAITKMGVRVPKKMAEEFNMEYVNLSTTSNKLYLLYSDSYTGYYRLNVSHKLNGSRYGQMTKSTPEYLRGSYILAQEHRIFDAKKSINMVELIKL